MMNIISGRVSAHSDCQNLDVFVDWHWASDEWSAEQQAYAYLPSGFRIDFYLAQLGSDFEDPRVSDMNQMKAAMADIAGSLHTAIFGLNINDFDKDTDDEEDEGFRW